MSLSSLHKLYSHQCLRPLSVCIWFVTVFVSEVVLCFSFVAGPWVFFYLLNFIRQYAITSIFLIYVRDFYSHSSLFTNMFLKLWRHGTTSSYVMCYGIPDLWSGPFHIPTTHCGSTTTGIESTWWEWKREGEVERDVDIFQLNLNVGFDKSITVDYLIKMEDYESIEISNPPIFSLYYVF